MPDRLTPDEQSRFDALCVSLGSTLAEIKRQYIKAGLALKEIRDDRLYRATHDSFDAFCQDVFGWSRKRADRLIKDAEAGQEVTQICPNATPAQARALADVPPDLRGEVWNDAVESSTSGNPTGRDIAESSARITSEPGDQDAFDDEEPTELEPAPPPVREPSFISDFADAHAAFVESHFADHPLWIREAMRDIGVEQLTQGCVIAEEVR